MIESMSPEACRIRDEALARYVKAKQAEPTVHELELEARKCDALAARADAICASTAPGISDESRTRAAQEFFRWKAKATAYRVRVPR